MTKTSKPIQTVSQIKKIWKHNIEKSQSQLAGVSMCLLCFAQVSDENCKIGVSWLMKKQ